MLYKYKVNKHRKCRKHTSCILLCKKLSFLNSFKIKCKSVFSQHHKNSKFQNYDLKWTYHKSTTIHSSANISGHGLTSVKSVATSFMIHLISFRKQTKEKPTLKQDELSILPGPFGAQILYRHQPIFVSVWSLIYCVWV